MSNISVEHKSGIDRYTDLPNGEHYMKITKDATIEIHLKISAIGHLLTDKVVAYYAPGKWSRVRQE